MKLIDGAVVFFFLGLYGAAQPGVYRQGIIQLVPLSGRARAEEVMGAIVTSLRHGLFGRVVDMVFVGLGTALGFWLLEIPVALALGLMLATPVSVVLARLVQMLYVEDVLRNRSVETSAA